MRESSPASSLPGDPEARNRRCTCPGTSCPWVCPGTGTSRDWRVHTWLCPSGLSKRLNARLLFCHRFNDAIPGQPIRCTWRCPGITRRLFPSHEGSVPGQRTRTTAFCPRLKQALLRVQTPLSQDSNFPLVSFTHTGLHARAAATWSGAASHAQLILHPPPRSLLKPARGERTKARRRVSPPHLRKEIFPSGSHGRDRFVFHVEEHP